MFKRHCILCLRFDMAMSQYHFGHMAKQTTNCNMNQWGPTLQMHNCVNKTRWVKLSWHKIRNDAQLLRRYKFYPFYTFLFCFVCGLIFNQCIAGNTPWITKSHLFTEMPAKWHKSHSHISTIRNTKGRREIFATVTRINNGNEVALTPARFTSLFAYIAS